MQQKYSLAGKVVLITGGARGIGHATARAALARGASVALLDIRGEDAKQAAAELHPERAIGLAADVSDRAAMQRAVADTVTHFGGLDVAVANAGIASRVATVRASHTESFDRVLDVNLMGVWRTVEAAMPQVIARRGHLVLISSIYAFSNGIGTVPYAMSKAAVEQLGRALRAELVQHGASVTVAYFGFIDTELVHRALDEDPLASHMLATLPGPLGKRLQPAVAGQAIVDAVEVRAPRVIRPRAWVPMFMLRGILGPLLDARLERDAASQALLRELDTRGEEDQPTTA